MQRIRSRFYRVWMEKINPHLNSIIHIGIKVCVENMQVYKFVEKTYENLCNIPRVYFTWGVGHDAVWGYNR